MKGPAMPLDNRYLLKQRQMWFVVVEVPPSLRDKLGRRLKVSLKTRDVNVARARRYRAVADLKDRIEVAKRAPKGSLQDPIVAEAVAYRDAMELAQVVDARGPAPDADNPSIVTQTELLDSAIAERAEAMEAAGDPRWQEFMGIARGESAPLTLLVDQWLAEGSLQGRPLRPQTAAERKAAVGGLGDWMTAEGLPQTIEAVTRKVAGRYVAAISQGREPATVVKLLQGIRGYWGWLIKRGHLPEDASNPWSGQAPRKPPKDTNGLDRERAFTDAEVALLLASPPDTVMGEFMLVAALTGMRREEIGRLRVKDCADGVFVIPQGKTAAAARRVPVHPELAAMVERRVTGKGPEGFLFADLPGTDKDNRTDAIGKTFTRYRRTLGIQDGDARRSRVNFHSFRRWFTTAAINAGQPSHVVSLVVGHAEGRSGMTLGRYWQGADDPALRAVVEAVRLPNIGEAPGAASGSDAASQVAA
jgi:integrase